MEKIKQWVNNKLVIILALLLAFLLFQFFNARKELSEIRSELAKRLQTNEMNYAQTQSLVKADRDNLKELLSKVSVLENEQAQAKNQQLALEQLYQDLSKTRDDWALTEIEQVLSTASEQLQLAGNVSGAVIALQSADSRLARLDKPQFKVARTAIAQDLEKLKTLPYVDVPGTAARLDSVIMQIDELPLLSDSRLLSGGDKLNKKEEAKRKKAKNTEEKMSGWEKTVAAWDGFWKKIGDEMWDGLLQVVSVRNVKNPDALLVSPSQSYFVKENLKLRLLNARLALLSRNDVGFRRDMAVAQDLLAQYFDANSKQIQLVRGILKEVSANNLAMEMPSLSGTLNALRYSKNR